MSHLPKEGAVPYIIDTISDNYCESRFNYKIFDTLWINGIQCRIHKIEKEFWGVNNSIRYRYTIYKISDEED